MIGILTKKHLAICFAALMSGACSGQTRATTPEAIGGESIETVMDAGPADAPGVSEAEARALLDRLFRAAGLRVVNDVSWTRAGLDVTLDGYDPELAIGYEYVAAAEAGVEVDASERVALGEHPRIFLAAPATRDQLLAAAKAFLAALPDLASADAAVSPAP